MLLTEEQILIRDSARRFAADHLTPNAATWDREGQFPAAALKAMGELGFMGMLIPGEWDGAGADQGDPAEAKTGDEAPPADEPGVFGGFGFDGPDESFE